VSVGQRFQPVSESASKRRRSLLWTAPAERSDDGPFERTRELEYSSPCRAGKSGVAFHLRSQSKMAAVVCGRRKKLPRHLSASGGISALLVVFALWCICLHGFAAETIEKDNDVRFEAVHVYVDSGSDELAAYQLLLRATKGDVKIVGIEGGAHKAFKEPPFYDPKAIQQERVILAAFSLEPKSNLPKGRVRVATIHLQVRGGTEPQFEAKLQAAANHTGKKISPIVSIEPIKP